jgi:hypothetical protein
MIANMKRLFKLNRRIIRAYGTAHDFMEKYNITMRSNNINKSTAEAYRVLLIRALDLKKKSIL